MSAIAQHITESGTAVAQPNERARLVRINTAIRAAARDLRARHGFLRHQDAIGFSLLAASAGASAAAGLLYARGILPGFVCLLAVALATSIAHEIEHDLIHQLYFRKNRVLHSLMMAVCWVLRPNTINPWLRRDLHLHHHKVSGTVTDLEERAITNGERFDAKRLLMMADGVLSMLLRIGSAGKRRNTVLVKFFAGYFPLGWVHFSLVYGFFAVHAARALFGAAAFSGWTHGYDVLVVAWLLPNVLRSFCLNFMSSNMHYFGDVESGNVLQQVQVLNAKRFLPLQLFCFNFGSTHAIHHFVANEPFYVRQWTAPAAHRALRENGIPFNDLGTFRRANRREEPRVARAVQADVPLGSRPAHDAP
ncbi:MAG TPA: fatty acid desaturase [Polyangiaceae bacterium]|nr:fatty acid desaturase [Polyangiaceae bacterium]